MTQGLPAAARAACRVALAAALALGAAGAEARTRTWTPLPGEMLAGEADGVAVTTRGRLFLAPRPVPLGDSSGAGKGAQVWAAAADASGNLYLGTGPDGRVVRITPSGKESVLFETGAPLVTALAVLPGGELLAAGSPGGKIFRVRPDGGGELWCETEERYVWVLAPAPDGSVLAGTGDEGRILRIGRSAKPEVLFDADEPHIVSLALLPGGGLLAGGAGRGHVYRLDGQANGLILHEDDLPEVRAVAPAADGSVFAAVLGHPEAEPRPPAVRIQVGDGAEVGAAPDSIGEIGDRPARTLQGTIEGLPPAAEAADKRVRGRVVRIAPDGSETEIWRSTTEAPFCLVLDGEGRPVFGTGEPARIYRVESADEVTLLATLREGQVTALVPAAGSLAAATSNPAAAYRLARETGEPAAYLSRPFDAGGIARWGTIRWHAEGDVSGIEMYTRTGNTVEPDATWSAWSPALTVSAGSRIPNPPGRFLQWRTRFAGGAPGRAGVTEPSVSFAPGNRPPRIRDFRLDGGESAVATKASFRWSSLDPDGDAVEIEVQVREEGAGPWTTAVRAEAAGATTEEGGEAPWREGKASWDAAVSREGRYEVRLAVNDRAANPAGEGAEAFSETPLRLLVDRTPPEVEARFTGDGSLEIHAKDALSPLSRVELLREGRVLFLAPPADGVCEGPEESFRLARGILTAAGAAPEKVRAVDAAGNVSERTLPPP